jgi:hypothetical protein
MILVFGYRSLGNLASLFYGLHRPTGTIEPSIPVDLPFLWSGHKFTKSLGVSHRRKAVSYAKVVAGKFAELFGKVRRYMAHPISTHWLSNGLTEAWRSLRSVCWQ